MKRGDIVTVAAPGDYGKPRPAVVVQSDFLRDTDSVMVALITTTPREAPLYRLTLTPSASNGLQHRSQIMVDKIVAVPRVKVGSTIGRVDDATLQDLRAVLTVIFGLAE